MSSSPAPFPEAPLSFSAQGFRVRHLFATPMLVAPLNDAPSLNRALRRAILARAGASDGVERSNRGGWQSSDDFWAWSGPAGEALLQAAMGLVNGVTELRGADGAPRAGRPAWRCNAWANINGQGHANHPHHHPGAFWSGVYWVDSGDGPGDGRGGELELHDPRGILPGFFAPQLRVAIPGCLSAGLTDYAAAETGTMVLFPSWLVHAVREYRGIRPRISVAFNFSV